MNHLAAVMHADFSREKDNLGSCISPNFEDIRTVKNSTKVALSLNEIWLILN
jgi:hypothetical protein